MGRKSGSEGRVGEGEGRVGVRAGDGERLGVKGRGMGGLGERVGTTS